MKLTTLAIATLSLLGYSSAFIPMSNINGPSSSPLASSTSLKVSNDIPEALRSQMSVEQLRKMEGKWRSKVLVIFLSFSSYLRYICFLCCSFCNIIVYIIKLIIKNVWMRNDLLEKKLMRKDGG